MAFCGKCGAYIAVGSNVCPACGKRVGEPEEKKYTEDWRSAAQTQEAHAENSEEKTHEDDTSKKESGAKSENHYGFKYNTHDSGHEYGGGEIRERIEKLLSGIISGPFPMIAVLSYFSFLFLVPLLLRNDSEFARFHANQGLVLLLFRAALKIVGKLTGIGWLIKIVGSFFVVVCVITGVSNVLQKRIKPLPGIGGIRLIK